MTSLPRRLFDRFLRKCYTKLNPYLGQSESMHAADDAVKRSDAAIKSVRWSEEQVSPAIEYLRESAAQNHYRLKVENAWRRRPT